MNDYEFDLAIRDLLLLASVTDTLDLFALLGKIRTEFERNPSRKIRAHHNCTPISIGNIEQLATSLIPFYRESRNAVAIHAKGRDRNDHGNSQEDHQEEDRTQPRQGDRRRRSTQDQEQEEGAGQRGT